MWAILIIILIVWAILAVLGFIVKGLIWLAIIGIVLFVATIVFAAFKGRINKS